MFQIIIKFGKATNAGKSIVRKVMKKDIMFYPQTGTTNMSSNIISGNSLSGVNGKTDGYIACLAYFFPLYKLQENTKTSAGKKNNNNEVQKRLQLVWMRWMRRWFVSIAKIKETFATQTYKSNENATNG